MNSFGGTKLRYAELDYLKKITGNNASLIKEFIQEALGLTKQVIPEINMALDLQDFNKIGYLSHQLKSSMKIFNSDQLVMLLNDMESLSDDAGQHFKLHNLVSQLNEITADWENELRQEFTALSFPISC